MIGVCLAQDNIFPINCFITVFTVFIPLLGIIFNVFYRIHREAEVSSVAHLSSVYLYLLPDFGRMNGGNM